jgi:hypothetical protein
VNQPELALKLAKLIPVHAQMVSPQLQVEAMAHFAKQTAMKTVPNVTRGTLLRRQLALV